MDFDKDAMDWTNIIMTLITSGAFTAIYLLGDRKTASVLENVSKTIDQWQGLLKEVKEELAAKTEEYKAQWEADHPMELLEEPNE